MTTRALFFLLVLLTTHAIARAGTGSCGADSAWVPIDTTTVVVTLPDGEGGAATVLTWEVTVERHSVNPNLGTRYTINANSFRVIEGMGAAVNQMTTVQLFDMMATATVARGVALGYTICQPACGNPARTTVVTPACVERTGDGSKTKFTECIPSGCCIRTYAVCCPNGPAHPQIMLVGSESTPCAGIGAPQCQNTCP